MKIELRILPWTLLSLYSLKLLILGAVLVDAPILLILAGFLAIFEYKEKDAKYKELKQELDQIKNNSKETEKRIEELKVYVSSIKLSAQAKNTNMFGRQ